MEPARSPVLFLELLPSCKFASARILLAGRTVEAVMVRSEAELTCGFATDPSFLGVVDGDEAWDAGATPFMLPAVGGRMKLLATLGWATTGAMMERNERARGRYSSVALP